MTDLFGLAGTDLLNRVRLPGVYRGRIDSLRRLMEQLEFEIDVFSGVVRRRLAADPGYVAVQTIPGIEPTLAAVFVAEIGDVSRFAGPDKLACWCGLTPKHHESDTHVHRGGDHQAGLAAGALGGGGIGANVADNQHHRRVPGPDRGEAGPHHWRGGRGP